MYIKFAHISLSAYPFLHLNYFTYKCVENGLSLMDKMAIISKNLFLKIFFTNFSMWNHALFSRIGKTYSALLLAYGLCNDRNKIAVVNTENHSA
jgi:hypothetical protein